MHPPSDLDLIHILLMHALKYPLRVPAYSNVSSAPRQYSIAKARADAEAAAETARVAAIVAARQQARGLSIATEFIHGRRESMSRRRQSHVFGADAGGGGNRRTSTMADAAMVAAAMAQRRKSAAVSRRKSGLCGCGVCADGRQLALLRHSSRLFPNPHPCSPNKQGTTNSGRAASERRVLPSFKKYTCLNTLFSPRPLYSLHLHILAAPQCSIRA